jgi:hypothetical protein
MLMEDIYTVITDRAYGATAAEKFIMPVEIILS